MIQRHIQDSIRRAMAATTAVLLNGTSATVGTSDFAALKELRGQLGEKFVTGAVLYTGDKLIPFGDKLWLVPLPTLWEE